VLLLVAGAAANPGALGWSLLAATVPAVGYGGLILALDRNDPEPKRILLFAFLWGALAAVVLALVLELVASTLLAGALGPDGGALLDVAVVAPLVEETTKGLALLILLVPLRRYLDNTLDGLVYGAIVGLGFALTENIAYFAEAYLEGGVRALGELFLIRSVINGLGHIVYTGLTGAAVGWARGRYGRGWLRLVVPALGWSAAVLAHGLWNTGSIAIGYLVAYHDLSLLEAAGMVGPLLSVPPALLAGWVALVARRHEVAVVRRHLGAEVLLGVISPREWVATADRGLRARAIREAEAHGGRVAERRQRRFFQLATRLALFNAHLARGERPNAERLLESQRWRWELASLRAALAGRGVERELCGTG
jgi:RsiW-degrading membrane proteinase PrsW (M82 family)